ncbi:MAG: hypothetical protein GY871_11370 [Actinomycetales bacterium]|nr:hypothetical protein [Actinomycetales bacterium]
MFDRIRFDHRVLAVTNLSDAGNTARLGCGFGTHIVDRCAFGLRFRRSAHVQAGVHRLQDFGIVEIVIWIVRIIGPSGGNASFGIVVGAQGNEANFTKRRFPRDVNGTLEVATVGFGRLAVRNEHDLVGTRPQRCLPWKSVLACSDYFLRRRTHTRDNTGDLK